MKLTDDLRREYEQRFATMVVNRSAIGAIASAIGRVMNGRARYEAVAEKVNVPWFVIGAIHNLECSSDFSCHLHNGDSLEGRTINVPRNRPVTGKPPFTWEESAIDALTYEGSLQKWDSDWSVAGTLFKLESYNGWGYRTKNVASPYLWGGSLWYQGGKFVRDGVFDRTAVSSQIGAAVILRRLQDFHQIEMKTDAQAAVRCEVP